MIIGFAFVETNAQCNFTVNAGPDLKVCKAGDMITINGKVTGNPSEIFWDPATGLSNPKSPVTKATVSGPIQYILTARGVNNTNLIVNGNFEAGKSGFFTDYIVGFMSCYGAGYLDCEGTYDVINNPQLGHTAWAPCGDHTSGSGLMMVLNGAAAFQNVWCENIAVVPNMDYVFTAWITSVISASPPILQFSINGVDIGPVFNSSGTPCLWEKYEVIWNSGSNNSALICILNENTAGGGNDFAIDDISFKKICEVKDTMNITIEEIIVDIQEPEIVTCDQPTQKLNAKASSNGPGWTYSWTTSDGKIVSGANTPEPVIRGPGTYYLTVCSPLPNCCITKSVEVHGRITPPDLILFVKDTLGCNNVSVSIVSRSMTAPLDYNWIGPNGYTNFDGPVISVIEGGLYILTITDEYNCKTIDSVKVYENIDNPKISIVSNNINCKNDTARLIGNSTIPGSKFEWTDPKGNLIKNDTFNVVDSGLYFLKVITPSGCVKYDSVRIKKDKLIPQITVYKDTLTCKNKSADILVNSSLPVYTIYWTSPYPFQQLDSYSIRTQQNGIYTAELEALNGCKNKVDVEMLIDTTSPLINPTFDTVTCLKPISTILFNCSDPNAKLEWIRNGTSGPDGRGYSDSVQTDKGGHYVFSALSENGCQVDIQFDVPIDTLHPLLRAENDTLNCIKTSLNLKLNDLFSSKYSWTGPNNFQSTQKNPSISISGIYQVTASLPNGCTSTQSINISSDFVKPVLQAKNDTLTCKKDSIALNASKDQINAIVNWTGPNGFQSNLINPYVSNPGSYQLIVTNPNGCKDSVLLTVFQDIGKPDLGANNDTLNCSKQVANLFAISTRDSLNYLWTGPNGFNATTQTIAVNQAGTYTIRISTTEGCYSLLNVEVLEDTIKPDLHLITDTLNCLKTQTSLQYNSGSNLISLQWTGPGNFNSNQQNPLITQGGNYTLKVTSSNLCTAQQTINILQDTIRPSITAKPDSINCNKREIDLIASVTPANLIGEWTTSTQQKIKANSIKTKAGGDFTFDVIGANYCINSILINVPVDTLAPDLQVKDDTINCYFPIADINAISKTSNLKYTWTGPNNYTSSNASNTTQQGGTYQISITAQNGCISQKDLFVFVDTVRPKLISTADSIDCTHPEATLHVSSDIGNVKYVWKNDQSQILSNTPNLKTKFGGNYIAEVVNTINGCLSRILQPVRQDSLIITDVSILPVNPICGKNIGSAQVVKVIGGHQNIKYSIDHKQSYTSNPDFNSLPVGQYTLFVIDDKKCEFQKDFEIVEIPFVETNLVPEITLTLGDSARMNLSIIPDIRLVKSIDWEPTTYLSCNNCEDPIVKPLVSTDYKVTVIDTNGCQSIQYIRIVVETPKVWVPNVFSPNGDNINDLVWIYGSKAEVTRINIFQIFDRWGNRVFENYNFEPNDPSKGWDGKFNSEKCNPGVYVYWAEVELIDGTKWIIKGDITLVR
jgi:gliding motility-associated-like protein